MEEEITKTIEDWIATQYGTAGWELKLVSLVIAMVKKTKNEERERIIGIIEGMMRNENLYTPKRNLSAKAFINKEINQALADLKENI